MRRSELPRLDLETVQPVTPPQRLHDITPDRQPSRLPLPHDVKVLVQHQVGIAPERCGRVAQQNAIAPGRGARTQMQACVEGVFEHAHVLDQVRRRFPGALRAGAREVVATLTCRCRSCETCLSISFDRVDAPSMLDHDHLCHRGNYVVWRYPLIDPSRLLEDVNHMREQIRLEILCVGAHCDDIEIAKSLSRAPAGSACCSAAFAMAIFRASTPRSGNSSNG